MMNKILLSSVLISSLLSASTYAQYSVMTPQFLPKQWSIGAGFQNLTVTNDIQDLDFTGHLVTAQYAFSNRVAVKTSYQLLDFDDNSDVSSQNIDIAAYYGRGFLSNDKLKLYAGIGYFADSWASDNTADDVEFSGFLIGGGLGYNWERMALDFIINARQASDYGEYIESSGGSGTVVAVGGSLSLSVRF
jgi:hypothetical protein